MTERYAPTGSASPSHHDRFVRPGTHFHPGQPAPKHPGVIGLQEELAGDEGQHREARPKQTATLQREARVHDDYPRRLPL